MGPSNFFPEIVHVSKKINIYSYIQGQRIGIDLMTILYAAVKRHAPECSTRDDLRAHAVHDVREYLFRFLSHGIMPMVVLDGQGLPAKADTQAKRRQLREENARKLEEAQGAPIGQYTEDQLRSYVTAAAEVDEELITLVVQAFRPDGICIKFAPYESDAQLVGDLQHNLIDYTLSLDGDLIVYGSTRAIYKFDLNSGEALLFDAALVQQTHSIPRSLMGQYKRFGVRAFAVFAALVGCDYGTVLGIGPVKALQILMSLKKRKNKSASVPMAGDATASQEMSQESQVVSQQGAEERAEEEGRAKGQKTQVNPVADISVDQIVAALVTVCKMQQDQVAEAREIIEKVLGTYKHHVIFDVKTKKLRPLSAEGDDVARDVAPPSCAGDVSLQSMIVDVQNCPVNGILQEPFSLTFPEAQSFGFVYISRDGQFKMRLLPAIDQLPIANISGLRGLSPAMVVGGEIDESAVSLPASGSPSDIKIGIQELMLFLQTRNYTGFQKMSKDEMVKSVRDRLALEKLMLAKGEQIIVRDRSGTCLYEVLMRNRLASLKDFPQYDEYYTVTNAKTWVGENNDINAIQCVAPVLTLDLVVQYLTGKTTAEVGSARILSRGYAHICSLQKLDSFRYCALPIESAPQACAFQFVCSASMRACSYRVTVLLEVDLSENSDSLKRVKGIFRALCEPSIDGGEACAQSGHGHGNFVSPCSHVSALLHVIVNLKRTIQNAHLESPTAKLCAWNIPNVGEQYPADLPIALMPFLKVSWKRDHVYKQTSAQLAASNSASLRSSWNPFPYMSRSKLAIFSTARRGRREALYQSIINDLATFRAPVNTGSSSLHGHLSDPTYVPTQEELDAASMSDT